MNSIRKTSEKFSQKAGNNLRELTQRMHETAENQPFAQSLIKGELTNKQYATYLFNQHPQYNLLETFAMIHDLLDVRVAPAIHADYQELWEEFEPHQPPLLPVVKEYMDHLLTIKEDPKKLMAHIYTRHMGDLSGGQIIKKKVPGSGRMYNFGDNVSEIKDRIRARCDDSLAEEANLCFDFATRLFEQMSELPNE